MDTCLIYGLIFDCPCKHEQSNCPMREIREKPIKERLEYVKNLPEKQKEVICQTHKDCLIF